MRFKVGDIVYMKGTLVEAPARLHYIDEGDSFYKCGLDFGKSMGLSNTLGGRLPEETGWWTVEQALHPYMQGQSYKSLIIPRKNTT
jgi:hypothetical protein